MFVLLPDIVKVEICELISLWRLSRSMIKKQKVEFESFLFYNLSSITGQS